MKDTSDPSVPALEATPFMQPTRKAKEPKIPTLVQHFEYIMCMLTHKKRLRYCLRAVEAYTAVWTSK